MAKQEVLGQITESFGFVPGIMEQMPEAILEQYWNILTWVLGDTSLSSRDKALVAFGAASAIHCPY
jgi:hypothetical protein